MSIVIYLIDLSGEINLLNKLTINWNKNINLSLLIQQVPLFSQQQFLYRPLLL